jgi:uncharacterized protein YjbI with pentapeptide repeats
MTTNSEHQQSASTDTRSTKLTLREAQDAICSYILKYVKTADAEEVLEHFYQLFIAAPDTIVSEMSEPLHALISYQNEEEFINTLKRCCYIMINNWHANRDYHSAVGIIEILDKAEYSEQPSTKNLRLLRSWLIKFTQNDAYQELKLFVLPLIESHDIESHDGASDKHPTKKTKKWSHRYTSYLLASHAFNLSNSEEQRDLARNLSKKLRDKFKFELAMYTARCESPAFQGKPLPNPTKLGDSVVSLIKKIVSQYNLFQYESQATAWLEQVENLSYKEFKASLQDYILGAAGKEAIVDIIKSKLEEKLKTLYESHDEEAIDKDLVLRSCRRTIEYFTTETGGKPAFLFILLTNGGNILTLVMILLKTIVLCPQVRPHLEICIARLIQYYENSPEDECRWFINFLEVFDLVFTLYTENVRYDLVKVRNQKLNGSAEEDDLDNYRLFCQAQSLKLVEQDLSGADLSGASFRRAELSGAKLSGANLSRTNFNASNLSHSELGRANLQYANLGRVDLSYADLSHANLSYADLRGANLTGANLSGANLCYANLDRAKLPEADLSQAQLRCVNLRYANLTRANLSGVDLTRAQLSHVNLNRTNLSDAYLRHTNLCEAQICDANLTGANLFSTNLNGAKLQGTRVGRNSGLSLQSKQYLKEQGAVFE